MVSKETHVVVETFSSTDDREIAGVNDGLDLKIFDIFTYIYCWKVGQHLESFRVDDMFITDIKCLCFYH